MIWQCIPLTLLAFMIASYSAQQNDYAPASTAPDAPTAPAGPAASSGTEGVSGGSSGGYNPAPASSASTTSGATGAQEPGANAEGGVDGGLDSQNNAADAAKASGSAAPSPAPASGGDSGSSGGGSSGGGGSALGSKTLQFPLPSCYINADGFMCCSKELEELMDSTYRNLSTSRNGQWKKCNIHQVAVAVQRSAQARFNLDFETVVGAGDYASKNYFSKDLICKIKRESSIILAFASPV